MPDDVASAPCASRLSAALASARARAVALAAAARAALAARRGEDAWSPRELAAAAPVTDDIVLTCAAGVRARVCRAGCAVRALELPDGTDVVLGHEDTVKYLDGSLPYFGVIVGRVANRIAGASFELDGVRYTLPRGRAGKDRANCLHGGRRGLDKRLWTVARASPSSVTLTYTSPDGEEGFPGTVQLTVTYELTPKGALRVVCRGVSDAVTPLSLTQHSYFNLDGADTPGATVLDHTLTIDADQYVETDALTGAATGVLLPVAGGTDLRTPTPISAVPGLDTGFVVRGKPAASLRRAALLRSPSTGRVLAVWTDAAAVQAYAGGGIARGTPGKRGAAHGPHAGIALETHALPNAVNVPGWTEGVLVRPGREYRAVVEYRLGVGAEGKWP